MMENWFLIFLGSAVISAIVSGITSFILEKQKFSREYWKIAIKKRIEVYDQLEEVLLFFQSVHIVDEKPCHLAFLNKESFDNLNLKLVMLTWKRNWISLEIFTKLLKLNSLLSYCDSEKSDKEITDFGTLNYNEIVKIRDEIIKQTVIDYIKMPNVKGFLKSKVVNSI